MKTIFGFVLIFATFIIVNGRRECVQKNLGNDRILCVCNMTYCDDLEPLKHQPSGTVTVFETNKHGDRFKETILKFEHTTKEGNHTVKVDRNTKYQKIIGIGGAFTDAGGINIASLPTNLQENIIDDYFSTKGIEYAIGRVPIGGADFSPRPYTLDDNHPDDFNLTHFSLAEEDYKFKIPFMLMANKVSPHKPKYFGSTWSPPAWMKTTNTINHGGVLKGKMGGEYYQAFANYIVKFLNEYKKNGVDYWGITVLNEPASGFDLKYAFNCLGLTPEMERDFIKLNLGPALEKAGYGSNKFNLMIDDDQRDHIVQWADTIYNDKEAAKYVSGLAFHWYANRPNNVQNLDKVHNSHPNYFILATEACEDFGHPKHNQEGDWSKAEIYAHDIMTDLHHWVSGWVEWNLALDEKTLGPNWAHLGAWAPILVNKDLHEYYKLPQFYVLGHFSKFLIPDSVRIQLNHSPLQNFETIAFERPDKSIVIIAYNFNDHPITLTIDDPKFGRITQSVSPHAIQSYIWSE